MIYKKQPIGMKIMFKYPNSDLALNLLNFILTLATNEIEALANLFDFLSLQNYLFN